MQATVLIKMIEEMVLQWTKAVSQINLLRVAYVTHVLLVFKVELQGYY